MNTGFVWSGTLSKKRKLFWEIQLFAMIRNPLDGITFFNFKVNLDTYQDEHTPAFQIEFTFCNLYNHIWIHKNNY